MSILEKVRKFLFTEDTVGYDITLQNFKEGIETLAIEYNELVSIQEKIKDYPRSILKMDFLKKDKYTEIMDKIKYKDVRLIKEYELYAMKYNILIELYIMLKQYITSIQGELLLDFQVDKYKQPTAILSPYEAVPNKIILLKNTFHNEDFIIYNLQEGIIKDICSKEVNVHHGKFMIKMLITTIEKLKENKNVNINELSVSKELIDKLGFDNCINFFKKQGFDVSDKVISLKI